MKSKVKNDIILIAAVVLIAAVSFALLMFSRTEGQTAVITVDGERYAELSLSGEDSVRVESAGGYNVVAVSDGKVSVTAASCPDLICKHHRAISQSGETIVCLPNKMVVEIK